MKITLLLVLLTIVCVALSQKPQPPNVPTSFTANFVNSDQTLQFRAYLDDTNQRARYDDLNTHTTEVILQQEGNNVNFTKTACETYCADFSYCPNNNEGNCSAHVENFMQYVNEAVYAGQCDGGNLWNYTNYITLLYCVGEGNVPVSFRVVDENEEFTISDWVPGVPDATVFAIPSYCDCIKS